MIVSAAEVEERFNEFMDKARQEPVIVEKTGRQYVVMMNVEEYECLRALEDHYWHERAMEAAKEGFLTAEESMASIQRRLAEIGDEE